MSAADPARLTLRLLERRKELERVAEDTEAHLRKGWTLGIIQCSRLKARLNSTRHELKQIARRLEAL